MDRFEELIKEYEKMMFNVAYRMLGNREDALDVTQEAIIKAYKNFSKYRGDSLFSTWVYRITVNKCIDYMRKSKGRMEELNDNTEYKNTYDDPQVLAENSELRKLVLRVLNKLKPEYKIVIILRDIYGFSYHEISEIVGARENTVKSRISRARNILKESIKKNGTYIDF